MARIAQAMEPLSELLERQMPALRAFLRLRAGPVVALRESVSDLAQSVCREVLEGRERFTFQGEAAFRSWLFTTALRKVLEKDRYYRAEKRDVGREVRAIEDSSGEARSLLDCYATFATPSKDLAASEQIAAVERAMDRLSEQQREVISLAKIAGLSHDEIGKALGITPESSRQILRRALLRIAKLVEEPGQEPGAQA